MTQSENINELAGALAKFQGECPSIDRNRTVKVKGKTKDGNPYSYDFRYATLDNIFDTVRKPLSENGLSFVQQVDADEKGMVLTTTLMHASGQWLRATMPIPMGSDRTPQAIGSAITYTKRYAISALLGLAADEDDDANAAEGNQVEVRGRTAPAKPKPQTQAKDEPTPEERAVAYTEKQIAFIRSCNTQDDLLDWQSEEGTRLSALEDKWPKYHKMVRKAYDDEYEKLHMRMAG